MPPLEDLPEDQDEHQDASSRSTYRVVSELGFVSSVIAGICIQRYGIIHQESPAADIAKILVLVAGAWTFGANMACLYHGSIFAPKYPNLAPPPRLRRRQGRRSLPAERQLNVHGLPIASMERVGLQIVY